MKQQRQPHVGIAGMAIGVLLGAGSVLSGHDIPATLHGNVLSVAVPTLQYRNTALDAAYEKRALHSAANAPSAQSLSPTEQEACAAKVRTTEALRAIILPLVPSRPMDQFVRASMQQAFDAFIASCKPWAAADVPVAAEAPVSSVASSTPFIADYARCDRLTGVRRTRCIAEQRDNQVYYQESDIPK